VTPAPGATPPAAGAQPGAPANGAPANGAPPNGAAPAGAAPAGAASTAAPAIATAANGAPAPQAPVAPVAPTGPGRTSEITNYEIGKVTRRTMSPQGQLARLSVAVILDDERVAPKADAPAAPAADGAAPAAAAAVAAVATTKSWEPAEIQRVHNLVAAAVGLDPARGDQLTVENIAFETPVDDATPAAPGIGTQTMDFAKRNWGSALRYTAIVTIALFALTSILRPLARRAIAMPSMPALPATAGGSSRLPTVQEMEGQIEGRAAVAAGATGQNPLPALTRRVAKLANDEPEQLARIVRGWMAEEER
jgi:flagellar M-ring protein FliF